MSRLGRSELLTEGGKAVLPILPNSSHLVKLIWIPRAGPNSSNRCTARSTAGRLPARTPSSRYQACSSKLKQSSSASIVDTSLWRAKENNRGPRGSPCCTPHSEVILPTEDGTHSSMKPMGVTQGRKWHILQGLSVLRLHVS